MGAHPRRMYPSGVTYGPLLPRRGGGAISAIICVFHGVFDQNSIRGRSVKIFKGEPQTKVTPLMYLKFTA